MPQHAYLEQGLSVLEARLKIPQPLGQIGRALEARPFITLGHETGAGATTIGQLLVPLLDQSLGEKGQGWIFFDKNLLAYALAKHNLPERLAAHLPEDKVSEIKAMIGEWLGLHPSLWELEHKVAAAILQLAHVGRVVIAGRAAYLITRSLPGGFHVKLVASPEVRAQRMMKLLNCDAVAAAAHNRETDLARHRYVKARFGRDIDDPHLYNLVINTDRISPTAVARLIIDALHGRRADLQAGAGEEDR